MKEIYHIDAANIMHEVIDGEVVVVNLENGTYYSLDGVGADLWVRLADGSTLEALVAGVAGIAILVLRSGLPLQAPALAAVQPSAAAPAIVAQPLLAVRPDSGYALAAAPSREPASYVVPPRSLGGDVDVPASLASFVVAHSEYSPPLVRRHLLSAWIGNDLVQTTPPSSSVLFNDAGAVPPANGTN